MLRSRLNFGLGPMSLSVSPDRRTTEVLRKEKKRNGDISLGNLIRTYENIDTDRGVRQVIIEVPHPNYPGLSRDEQHLLDTGFKQIQKAFNHASRRVQHQEGS